MWANVALHYHCNIDQKAFWAPLSMYSTKLAAAICAQSASHSLLSTIPLLPTAFQVESKHLQAYLRTYSTVTTGTDRICLCPSYKCSQQWLLLSSNWWGLEILLLLKLFFCFLMCVCCPENLYNLRCSPNVGTGVRPRSCLQATEVSEQPTPWPQDVCTCSLL